MTKQFETLSVVAVRDYRFHSGYEYVITTEEDETFIVRKGGFKTAAAARRAALKAVEPLLAPVLF
jgi:hypothetical protein